MSTKSFFEIIHSLNVCLILHDLSNFIQVNSDMAYTEGNEATMVLEAKNSTLSKGLS